MEPVLSLGARNFRLLAVIASWHITCMHADNPGCTQQRQEPAVPYLGTVIESSTITIVGRVEIVTSPIKAVLTVSARHVIIELPQS
jgi:hypothetical protein